MSKFISSPAKMVGRGRSRAFPARGSLTTASRSGDRPQCLDLGANIRLDRGVVRALRELLVGRQRRLGRALVLGVGLLRDGAAVALEDARDRIVAERLAELRRRRHAEDRARARQGLIEKGHLGLLEIVGGLRRLDRPEVRQRLRVLRPERDVLLVRGDRLGEPPFPLVRRRELLLSSRVARILVHLLLSLLDRGRGAPPAAQAVPEEVAEVESAGADPEEDEAGAEDDDHDREGPLRLLPQAREEQRVLDYARGAAAAAGASAGAGGASMARLALCAAAVSSCHSKPPFS